MHSYSIEELRFLSDEAGTDGTIRWSGHTRTLCHSSSAPCSRVRRTVPSVERIQEGKASKHTGSTTCSDNRSGIRQRNNPVL